MFELEALLLSAAIEAPVAFLIVRATRWPSRGPLHAGFAAAVATAVTHPQFWSAALWAFPRFGFWPSVLTLEVIVILVEGCLIGWMAHLSLRHALMVSLAANSASFALGLLISR
ncbi:MAG: hypothetical protein WCA81_02690 [Rhizomicrobium sp.]